jgi:hypothetical protein
MTVRKSLFNYRKKKIFYSNFRENSLTKHYGFLKFDDNEPDKNTRPSQFIRLALKTEPDKIVQFMREGWRLPTPDLIISITGGAKRFELPARLRKAFQLGLVSAAATTSKPKYIF